MKIIGVIPARHASTRLPGKPLIRVQGKTLLQWTYENALRIKGLSQILIATDHQDILAEAQAFGAKVIMTGDCETGTDRIWSAIQGVDADLVVNIQGDEPLLNPLWIERLVAEMVAEPSTKMGTLGHSASLEDLTNPNSVKVLVNEANCAIYFSRFPIPFSRLVPDQSLLNSPLLLKHIGLYAYNRDFLARFCSHRKGYFEVAESLEQLRALEMNVQIKVVKVDGKCLGIDTPEDLEEFEKIVSSELG